MRQDLTSYLSAQAKRAVEEHGAKDVVVASLTRTAAEEVAGRDTGIPKKNVSTLHAHAYRALDHPAIADVSEGFREWNRFIGTGPLQIRESLNADLDAPPMESIGSATDGEILLAEYGIERNRMTSRDTWRPRLREFANKWENWKREAGRIDFTDMIAGALREVPRLPGDPKVLMLDEAQDLSRLEMALAHQWGEQTEHFVTVGDQDQNLFLFRGSDPNAFTEHPAASEHVLSQSYRVPRAVHAYAVDWIEKMENRAPVKYEPRDFEGAVELERSTWAHPEAMINKAGEEMREGKSVMILATCAYMLDPVIRVMRQQGTPYHNPYRPENGRWNPMRAAYRVLAFLAPQERDMGSLMQLGAGVWSWGEMRAWTDPLLARGVMTRGAKSLIEQKCQKDRFGDSQEDEIPPLEEMLALFEETHHEALLHFDLGWWESKLRTKRKQGYAYPLEIMRRHGKKALTDTPSLITGTVHSVKGGESASVFVCPDISRRGAEEARSQAGKDAMRRLLYVAFTRASEKLSICRPDAEWYLSLPDPGSIENP